jgi:hypothetical protein
MNGLYAALPGRPDFDTDKHKLGKLCPNAHDWMGTGQTLRSVNGSHCIDATGLGLSPGVKLTRKPSGRKTRNDMNPTKMIQRGEKLADSASE